VLLAQRAGVPLLGTVGLYLLSDVVLAFTSEPLVKLFRWLGRHVQLVGRVGQSVERLTAGAGLEHEGARSALGLVILSFAASPRTARAAAAAVGHGFVPGWTLAIVGDMAYFALLLVSTLWLSSTFGDDRLTIGITLAAAWFLPLIIQRLRKRSGRTPEARAASSTHR